MHTCGIALHMIGQKRKKNWLHVLKRKKLLSELILISSFFKKLKSLIFLPCKAPQALIHKDTSSEASGFLG